MKKIAIITARGGSKRIPRKNIKEFAGKPIISYSIEAATESNLFDEVMVSTDDLEIADIARKFGASIPFMRSAKNSDDHSATSEVITEVIEQYQSSGKKFEYACCIYPTAPLLRADTLKKAWALLIKQDLDTVFPVLRFGFPIQRALKMSNDSLVSMFQPENLNKRSQDLEPAYHDAGQFYFLNIQRFLKIGKLYTERSGGLIIKEMEAHDIDNEEDWMIAEFKYDYSKRINKN